MAGKQGRGRPTGSKNKDPFIRVRLGDLIEGLTAEYKVPVKKSWAVEVLGIDEDLETQTVTVNTEADSTEDEDEQYEAGGIVITPPDEL